MARASFAGLILLTSFYSLLVYVPLTYYGLIQHTFLHWLDVFVHIYAYLYWACLSMLLVSLRRDLSVSPLRSIVLGFAFVHVVFGALLLFLPHIDCLPHDFRSLVWAIAIPVSLIWLGIIDHVWFAQAGGWRWPALARKLSWRQPILAGILMWSSYSPLAAVRWMRAGLKPTALIGPAFHSLMLHLLLASLGFVLLSVLSATSFRAGASNRTQFYVFIGLLWAWGFVLLLKLALPVLSLDGESSLIFAGMVSLAIAVSASGLSLRWHGPESECDPLRLTLYAFVPLRRPARAHWIVALLAAPLLVWGCTTYLMHRDWESLLQRLVASLLFTVVIAFVVASARSKATGQRREWPSALVIALISFGGMKLSARPELVAAVSTPSMNEASDEMEQYEQFDPSAKAILDILAPPRRADCDPALLAALQHSMNITGSIDPVEISARVTPKRRNGQQRPNIFIFVIDSLRQDYVAPYNSSVDFTPNIAALAADGIVYRNAFTRYNGTVLAEPSIWAGALVPYKHYLHNFEPMNALQNLVEAEGYQRYISMDDVLQVMLDPASGDVILNPGLAFKDTDLCSVLEQLERSLASRPDKTKPIFVYSQPANLHVAGIVFGKNHVRPKFHSPGFDPERATELERVDAALGRFVSFLKVQGMYDNSLIVITSDHGDDLGEYGRFGHMGMPYPELLRIPLIVHLPKADQSRLVANPEQVAFNIDITPTIYYLLGYGGLQPQEIAGRPLFARTQEELSAYAKPDYLVASSYASFYGLLSGNGSELFILDVKNGTTYFYNLADDPTGLHNHATPATEQNAERKIREYVEHLDAFYHIQT